MPWLILLFKNRNKIFHFNMCTIIYCPNDRYESCNNFFYYCYNTVMNIYIDIFICSHTVPPALGPVFLMSFDLVGKLQYFHMTLIFIFKNIENLFIYIGHFGGSINCLFWFFAYFLIFFLIHLHQLLVFKDNSLLFITFDNFFLLEFLSILVYNSASFNYCCLSNMFLKKSYSRRSFQSQKYFSIFSPKTFI